MIPAVTDEILVFAKYPEAGRCKTRLARSVGDEAALRIYRALLAHTLAVIRELPQRKVLFADPPESALGGNIWAPGMDLHLPQAHGDLGDRLADAVAGRLAAGAHRLIVIGCDCPQISKKSVESSFAALNDSDAVLGPASDGGYYLLGLKKSHPSLFRDVPWGTEKVLEKTINILKFQSLSYILLDTFSDVDTLEDFQRVRHLEPFKHLGIR